MALYRSTHKVDHGKVEVVIFVPLHGERVPNRNHMWLMIIHSNYWACVCVCEPLETVGLYQSVCGEPETEVQNSLEFLGQM